MEGSDAANCLGMFWCQSECLWRVFVCEERVMEDPGSKVNNYGEL